MVEHIVAQAVFGQWVVDQIATVGEPVLREFLGAKDQHVFVALFIVSNDRECSEGFAESYAVCQYAAVIHLQFVDDGEYSIFLEII